MAHHPDSVTKASSLFTHAMLANPYVAYKRLREKDPVCWDDAMGAWILTGYDDIVTALHDPRLSSDRTVLGEQRLHTERFHPVFRILRDMMVQADNPKHMRIRRLVNQAFSNHDVTSRSGFIQRVTNDLLENVSKKREFDLLWDFAVPLPIRVIAEILGLPFQDRERFKQWCDDFVVVGANFYAAITEEQLEKGLDAANALKEYLVSLVEELHANPRDDLLSALVHAEEDDDRLSLGELLANTILLLAAGNETTTNLIGNGMLALLDHPKELDRLRQDRSLIPTAVEELLRYDTPAQFVGRVALEDLEASSVPIGKGQMVIMVLGSANRDPLHFHEPDQLDVGREDNKHLAFGVGQHFCAGSHLARLEGQIAFGSLLGRFDNIRRARNERPTYRENFNLRGLNSLPVVVDP